MPKYEVAYCVQCWEWAKYTVEAKDRAEAEKMAKYGADGVVLTDHGIKSYVKPSYIAKPWERAQRERAFWDAARERINAKK